MRARLVVAASIAVLGVAAATALAAPEPYQRPGRTERVSVGRAGVEPNGAIGGAIGAAGNDMSADARYLVFASEATNLVPGDTNDMIDVFRHDRVTGKTVRVSVASDGSQALPGTRKNCPNCGSASYAGGISDDGRYVAFVSSAMNLVPGDTNLADDAFVRDLLLNRTVRVSVSSGGTQGNSDSGADGISSDGRYVLMGSRASNLVPGDTNGGPLLRGTDVFVHDVRTGATKRVSVASDGSQAEAPIDDAQSTNPSISGNGRVVSFHSDATNLAPGPTANEICGCGVRDVYAHDLQTGRTTRVTVASDGTPASFSAFPTCTNICFQGSGTHNAVSHDGRFVTFISNATNLVPNDTNMTHTQGFGVDVFVRDLLTGRTERVSVDSYGHEQNDQHRGGAIASGRYVAYQARHLRCTGPLSLLPKSPLNSDEACYVVNRQAGLHAPMDEDSYVYDRLAGTMEWVSPSSTNREGKPGACDSREAAAGFAANATQSIALSADGRYALMYSAAQDLAPQDTNNRCDYFIRDRGKQLGAGALNDGTMPVSSGGTECLVDLICLTADRAGDVAAAGADLIGARLIVRDSGREAVVRWDVRKLAAVTGTPDGGVLYGMSFTASGSRYQVRAQRVPGPDYDAAGGASFGLFRENVAGVWLKVTTLKGGYGTIGDSVVTAVPLSLLGGKAQLTDVTADTAVGSYLSGPTKVLDSLRLAR